MQPGRSVLVRDGGMTKADYSAVRDGTKKPDGVSTIRKFRAPGVCLNSGLAQTIGLKKPKLFLNENKLPHLVGFVNVPNPLPPVWFFCAVLSSSA